MANQGGLYFAGVPLQGIVSPPRVLGPPRPISGDLEMMQAVSPPPLSRFMHCKGKALYSLPVVA